MDHRSGSPRPQHPVEGVRDDLDGLGERLVTGRLGSIPPAHRGEAWDPAGSGGSRENRAPRKPGNGVFGCCNPPPAPMGSMQKVRMMLG